MKPEEILAYVKDYHEETLAYVKDYLEETKIWEEEYLRIRYGSKWSQYFCAHVGIGYEICEELLDKITELERQPDISNTGRGCIEEINARRILCNVRLAINRYCSKHCPEQVCGRCTLKAFSDVAIGKPLDYETNSKSPRRALNLTDQKGGADMSESN